MLESTFTTVIQRWNTFDAMTRKKVESTLQTLLKKRTRLIRNTIVTLPSLSQLPDLSDVETQLNTLRTPTDISNAFQIFSRRIKHENSGVVNQALVELKAYLKVNQSFLQASAVSEQPDVVIGLLVRSILDSCVNFNHTHPEIARLSAECIGMIGCLDSNRVECAREQRDFVVLSNFHDSGETTDFVLFFLEEVLVKAFLSTSDTGVQGYFSYVMQVLLEKCDFSTICEPIIFQGKVDRLDHEIYQKWLTLPGSVQDTLAPFLNSKYSLVEISQKVEVKYPIFRPTSMKPGTMYIHWMKTFVMDLLYQPFNINADLIFTPIRRAVRIRDNAVAEFMLPYAVLHAIVDGEDKLRQQIGEELLSILKYQITADSHVNREELKKCSEVKVILIRPIKRYLTSNRLYSVSSTI
jgi:serine/threonine-protein kinase ATR